MRHVRRLLPITAVLAATLAIPTAAAADPACVIAGYSVLGSGTERSVCVDQPLSSSYVSYSSGNPDLVGVSVTVWFPSPLAE